jgi:2-keto-4-pentenoate hydratase
MAAPLPHVLDSGAKWPVSGHDEGLAIEAELALRLNKTPDSPDDIEDCIGSICACIELVGTRLAGGMQAPLAWKMADQQVHVGLVIGKEIAFSMRDWSEQRCRVTINGGDAVSLKGTHPTGNPLGALRWLASHASEYYEGLRAGDLITTGAWFVGPASAGDTFDVEFEGVGTVNVGIVS